MKLETSPSKRRLHYVAVSVQKYLCRFYYSISQKVITLSGRRFITVSGVLLHYRALITLSGVFYYIIGHVLQYRAFITLSVSTRHVFMRPGISVARPKRCSALSCLDGRFVFGIERRILSEFVIYIPHPNGQIYRTCAIEYYL